VARQISFPSHTPLSVITGATGDLGGVTARLCAEENHVLVLVGRKKEKLEAIRTSALEHGARAAITVRADLADIEGAAKVINAFEGISAGPRYLFNIAGMYKGDDELTNPYLKLQLYGTKLLTPRQLLNSAIIPPWSGVVYSSSQAELFDLPNSSKYGKLNRKGSIAHIEARRRGIDAKTVLFGNIQTATSQRFGLTSADTIPLEYAALSLLHTIEDPSVAARIILPSLQHPESVSPQQTSAQSQDSPFQERTLLVSELGDNPSEYVRNYISCMKRLRETLTLPRIG
jgi:NAD(P)-dependent dehydrogenase (short-subunit alcohol dehydrogenase family)